MSFVTLPYAPEKFFRENMQIISKNGGQPVEKLRRADVKQPTFCMWVYIWQPVTLAVTFTRRSYGNMYIMKAECAYTDSSYSSSNYEHL